MRTIAPPRRPRLPSVSPDGLSDSDTDSFETPRPAGQNYKATTVKPSTYRPGSRPVRPLARHSRSRIRHATDWMGYGATRPASTGTSLATYDQLGSLHYGSELMNVTGDRTVKRRLGHHGVRRRGRREPESSDIVKDGGLDVVALSFSASRSGVSGAR